MNERSIFAAALDIADPGQRAAYLDDACGNDPQRRRHIEDLLAAEGKLGSFLARPPEMPDATGQYVPIAERPGTVIGPYKLMEQIGEGGMGLVFVAEQQEPVRRKVALKVIKPGMDTRDVIARFEAERQALAIMDHPNIARVLDAGATESGRPYFVMELVKGVPITDYCDQHQLTPGERLELFVSVCQAVQHAHTKGIIHRDLKPSNILIAPHDGKPVVKVIDFGVAKAIGQPLTDKTIYTCLTQMIGTPLYMSPEQAEINALDVDTRSDIYALGVLLYELLTGTTPFDSDRLKKAAFDEIRRIIREEDPPRPSTRLSTLGEAMSGVSTKRKTEAGKLSALVSGELDWIVMRCLEKDRARRYETANGLARDVERYLHDEPVEACPPTAGYRLRKFARKHRNLLTTAAAFAALLLLGVVVSTWQAVRATEAEGEALIQEHQARANAAQAEKKEQEADQQRDEAQKERDEAQRQRDEAQRQRDEAKALNDKLQATEARLRRALYVAEINRAQHALEVGGIGRARELLEQQRPKKGESDLRHFEWHYLYRLSHADLLTLKGHTDMVFSVAYSPDGKHLASASRDRTAKVWDTETGKEVFSLPHDQTVNWVAYSPDGKHLATRSAGGTVRIWDVRPRKEVRTLPNTEGLAFSPDGKTLASGSSDNTIKLWDAASGQERATLKGHTGAVSSLAFSPDGKTLASASRDKTIKLWDVATGQGRATLKGTGPMAFSPDGKTLRSASPDGTIKVWDAEKGNELRTLKGATGTAPHGELALTLDPNGKRLASIDSDRTVRVWDAETGEELARIKGHSGAIEGLAFSPDGERLASASRDSTVQVWDARTDLRPLTLKGEGFSCVAFSPDGKRLVTSERFLPGAPAPGHVKVWDAQTGKELITLKGLTGPSSTVAFSPDGKRVAADGLGEVKVWDAQTGKEILSLKGHGVGLAFSPDGKRLARMTFVLPRGPGGQGQVEAKVYDAVTGNVLVSFHGPARFSQLAFSPDGKRLTGVSTDNTVKVWDAESGKELLSIKSRGMRVAFSPDGKSLAGGLRNEVKVWDGQMGKELLTCKGHTDRVTSMAFGPDGKRLASASSDNTVKVWDAQTGEELLTLKHTGKDVLDDRFASTVIFSPDGHRLASTSAGGQVTIWDATPLLEKR